MTSEMYKIKYKMECYGKKYRSINIYNERKEQIEWQ